MKNLQYPARLLILTPIAISGLFHLIISFTNITDYAVNFEFVKHVLSMDTLFPISRIKYRSIDLDILYHLFYIFIITLEICIAFFLIQGSILITKSINKPIDVFEKIKADAYIGLMLSLILWMFCFSTVGSEWFGMWQSVQWNATDTAQRLSIIHLLIALICYNVK